MILRAGFLLAVCLVSAATAADVPRLPPAAAGFDPARLAMIDGLVEEALAADKMPGCVVCIGRRDGIALLRAYGRRAVRPAVEPMAEDTVFDLASLTKPVATATAIMRLVEEGRLRLSDPVAAHIPEFAAHCKEKLTVHDLLTHQSGLIADNPIDDYADGPAKALEKIWNLAPLHPAATKFIYSDVNFIVLGQLVERISGE
jgi:CubicO group peptidase (beta-lactamase class C family)